MTPRDVHSEDMFHDDPLLSAFAREVRDAAEHAPLPVVEPTLAAVLEGRSPAAAYPDLALPVAPRAGQVRRLRLALAATGAAAAVVALAAAGSLPDPAQEQAARLASMVGVEIPDGDEDHGTPVETTTTTTTSITTSTTAPSTTATTAVPSSVTTVELPADTAPDTVPPVVPGDNRDHGRGSDNDANGDDDADRSGRGDGDEDTDGKDERGEDEDRDRAREVDEHDRQESATTEP